MAPKGSPDWASVKIAENGWACTAVMPDKENDLPSFVYTIGFPETLDAPDVIIVGFPGQSVHGVLAEIFDGVKSERLVLDDRAHDLDGVIKTFKVRIRPVPEALARETAFGSVHRQDPPRLVQQRPPLEPPGFSPRRKAARFFPVLVCRK